MSYRHVSVMPNEVISMLNCRPGKIYVDGTLGGAGHAALILEKSKPDGRLIGIDQDEDAIRNAVRVLDHEKQRVHLFHDNYFHLKDILSQLTIDAVDGILLDLGLSLNQLENSGRGFSFMRDEPLDMRMNTQSEVTAEDIINRYEEKSLASLFWEKGEERWSRPIAKKIVAARKQDRIRTSKQLADIICEVVPFEKRPGKKRIHPATKVFMALRIQVNQELEVLEGFLETAVDLLNPGGRLCILSFHSLEDRIVKQAFRRLDKGCTCPSDFPHCVCGKEKTVNVLTRKVRKPSEVETIENPMSRSTKLRAVEKI
ncbi:MAG: 16S rRNA (cytosine(1402)-N(4))-methyltransferase RsmH [Desulfobacteraceae bacterium]|nr:MAG: 16S rRNA (cytosine(1402)-N(4))-methyltransferase RsmH [Desulfobacteraceae bacterium]